MDMDQTGDSLFFLNGFIGCDPVDRNTKLNMLCICPHGTGKIKKSVSFHYAVGDSSSKPRGLNLRGERSA